MHSEKQQMKCKTLLNLKRRKVLNYNFKRIVDEQKEF